MTKFELQCNKWVKSHDYLEFLKIFLTEKGLTFDIVNSKCIELGLGYQWRIFGSTISILDNLYDIVSDYNLGESTITLCEKYEVSRTSLQNVLSRLGILRSKSEAASNAIKLGRYSVTGNFYKYNLNGVSKLLRSTYELAVLQQFLDDKSIKLVEYESLCIPYINLDNLPSNYIPDFKVTYLTGEIVLYEVKPSDRLEDELVKVKESYARDYCKLLNWKYQFLTEFDINWDKYPNYRDTNLLNYEPKSIESTGFITHIYDGTYKYSEHPRAYVDITYQSIMEWINSSPQYTLTLLDVYDWISRNTLIIRLRDEAPDDEKDIRRWMCKYLNADSLPTGVLWDSIKMEYQLNGIRDFHLPTVEGMYNYLSSIKDRECRFSDLLYYTGYSRNKFLKYTLETLNWDPYEAIKEINNLHGF